jgi:phosphoesterase RecJ-like protein
MVCVDGVPRTYQFLVGSDAILKKPVAPYDCAITLDCSDLNRIGELQLSGALPDLNIDHHATNLNFARINLVDPKAVATAEIITRLLAIAGVDLDADIAAALLTGILTDTIGFRTSNTTPAALRLAADLFEAGGNLVDIYQQTLINRSFNDLRLWGSGLSNLERENGIVWSTLTLNDRLVNEYPGKDDADLINLISTVDDADVFILFNEQSTRRIKVSWRARNDFDISGLAYSFGGGGHPAAAGAEIDGKLDEVKAMVIERTRQLVHHQANKETILQPDAS